MSKLLSRLSCRQIARVGFVFCALALVATPVFAQTVAPPKDFVPPKPPKDYKPLDVGPCEKPPQSIGLELHTTSASGADPHWIVSGPSGGPSYGGPTPYHTTLSAWAALKDNWVQPNQSATADSGAPAGLYTYTIWFTLSCPPEFYRDLRLDGAFAADNNGWIYLNSQLLQSCTNNNCFNQPPTTFSTVTGFVPNLNSLSVVVYNASSYTGASVNAKLSGTCVRSCEQRSGFLKVCKVAGPGIAIGTLFNFTAGASTFTVPAGPAPGGTCVVVGAIAPVGSNVTVAEIVPAGNTVSSIAVAVAPPGQVVSTNLGVGSVNVILGTGVTEVTFTDKRTGFLEICKSGKEASGDFTFSVNPGGLGPFVVPAGACSPAIEVVAGTVFINELPSLGFTMTDCATLPPGLQGPCNPAAQTSTVTVAPGDISTMTIAFVTNVKTKGGTEPAPQR